MGTTFGVRIEQSSINNEEIVEVARRHRHMRWTNDLAHLLPDDTRVEPLDNSAQGIYDIGDIKRSMREEVQSTLEVGNYVWNVLAKQYAADIYADELRDYEIYSVDPDTGVESLIDSPEILSDLESFDNLLLCVEIKKNKK